MQDKGLGRGLSVFFNEDLNVDLTANQNRSERSIIEIDIGLIDENPYQPRKVFDDDAISSLASSIKEHGVLQPIVVQRGDNGRYILIAGERRLRASKSIRLEQIPCIVNEEQYSKEKMLELAILENIQRENLDVIEEADAYKRLSEEFGQTQEKISIATGKSRSHIANMLRLNALPTAVKNLVHEKKITFGHARALVGIKNADEIAQKIVKEDLSVRQVENLIRDKKLKFQDHEGIYEERSETNEICHHISEILNLDVKIKMRGKNNDSGTIEISFNNSSELDRFMQAISR